jgi:hypothetical protein
MDFNKLATVDRHEAGSECNILDPVSGKPTDVFIKVQGADSKAWRAAKKRQTTAIIAARAASKDDVKALEDLDIDFDTMDIDALVHITMEWRGIEKDGKPYKCTPQNAESLYKQSPAVVRQLLAFLSDGENFTDG